MPLPSAAVASSMVGSLAEEEHWRVELTSARKRDGGMHLVVPKTEEAAPMRKKRVLIGEEEEEESDDVEATADEFDLDCVEEVSDVGDDGVLLVAE